MYRASDFLKKQIETKRVNSCLKLCSQKKPLKNTHTHTHTHTHVFLKIGDPNRKNLRKWNYGWSSRLKTCTAPTVDIFE